MKTTKISYLLILFITLCLSIAASANSRFKQLTITEGLAHTDANCITQDSIGLIWIGTYSGLQSYDGYSLTHYDYYPAEQKIYQTHNRIHALACTKDFLWIGTESGLTCFNLKTRQYTSFHITGDNRDCLNEEIYQLCFNASTNLLLIRTNRQTVIAKVTGKQLHILPWNSDEERIRCKSLQSYQAQGNSLWGRNGWEILQLNERNGKAIISNRLSASSLLQASESLHEFYFQKDSLYLCSEKGFYRITLKDGKPDLASKQSLDLPIQRSSPSLFTVTPTGDLWYKENKGLIEIHAPFSGQPLYRSYLSSTLPNSLSALRITDLLIDSSDNLWVTTLSQGVFYHNLSTSPFQTISDEEFRKAGFAQREVVAVTEQANGTLWMITEYHNLFKYDPQSEILERVPIELNLSLQTLYMDADQEHLYIGTVQGIFVYIPSTRRLQRMAIDNDPNNTCLNSSISYLNSDSLGRLWVATWGNGIYCISSPTSNPYISLHLTQHTDPALLSNKIVSFHAKGNQLFLCTTNGLNRIHLGKTGNVKQVSSYQVKEQAGTSMSTNYLASVDCENDSVCWVGTIGGGLNRLVLHSERDNDYTATIYTTHHGLPGNDCEIVLIDTQGKVWIGSNEMACLNPQSGQIKIYGNDSENKAFKVCVFCKGKNGLFYMGGLYGLTYFNPIKKQNDTPPACNLILSEITIDNITLKPGMSYQGNVVLQQALNYTPAIRLNHRQGNFSISFSALNCGITAQLAYRYRLQGLNDTWNELPPNSNTAHFSNLPYGSYRLEVQYSADKGVTWNEPGRILAIDLLPPWWWSTGMKTTYLLLIAGIIAYILRHYVKEEKLKQENEIQKILLAQDEEKYQAKIRFFMNASHELKTPLTLIRLAAEKLTEKNQTDKDCLAILHQTKRMLGLISELADFRKDDVGICTLNKEEINLSATLQNLVSEITPWAKNKQLAISYQEEEDAILLDADSEKLCKLIINLLSNAIKYTAEGGHITLSLHRGKPDAAVSYYPTAYTIGTMDNNQEAALLVVRDTGVGISADSIRRIYERFFQVAETSGSHLGSGIGLAIVKNIVLQHQGVITVSSERGKGTEFIVALPIRHDCIKPHLEQPTDFDFATFIQENYNELPERTDTKEENPATEHPRPDSPTLLIVEDNRDLQHALSEHFQTAYNVLLAANGKEGLASCLQHFPDLIVSDVMMPEMNGIEMCRHIKNNLSTACIPVVILTAKDNVESQIEGYESGADLYLPKPFSMKLLDVNLQRLLKQREQLMKGEPLPDQPAGKAPTEPILPASPATPEETDCESPEEQERIQLTNRLKEIIRNHIQDTNLSPDFLASEVGLSRSNLYLKVKRIDGQSLADYVRNCRLEKAAYLLIHTRLTSQEIMIEIGLTNASHFSKIFRMKYDMSPYEYRTQHKE